ncbi:hypothetical protein TeGR_g5324 [Tetraparma gracilis]|uniref:Methyltransferase domain-containing protein n=1 Tax=Tetraparma gracilis TaxID=2962635 RepID=A0ABQ6NB52_9STRA|nr:hypothetical protein TeGR_g5324 [Tetraparma gracilis]
MQSSDYYYDSYSQIGIHATMLLDLPRTTAYHSAISTSPLFRDAVVLDVGAGTGVLAVFAARAGAREVHAVDASAAICEVAREVVEANGVGGVVTVHNSSIENWEPPPGFKADIIVSEWMGYLLTYESMLDSVLLARDLHLRPGGAMFPDRAALYLFGYNDPDDPLDGLEGGLCGVDLSAVARRAREEPVVDKVDSRAVVTDAQPVYNLDLLTCNVGRTRDLTHSFSLRLNCSGPVTGIGGYFDVGFLGSEPPVGLSTAPAAKETHWKQTLFPLAEPAGGERVEGTMRVRENERNKRDLDITLEVGGCVQEFKMR